MALSQSACSAAYARPRSPLARNSASAALRRERAEQQVGVLRAIAPAEIEQEGFPQRRLGRTALHFAGLHAAARDHALAPHRGAIEARRKPRLAFGDEEHAPRGVE